MITLLLIPLLNSCADPFERDSGKPIPFSPEAFVDSSPDADTDADMDTDTDTDADADSDADTDSDTDTDVLPCATEKELCINEVMITNTQLSACGENFPDYIEIYNGTSGEVSLGVVSIENHKAAGGVKAHVFKDDDVLEAGGRRTVWMLGGLDSPCADWSVGVGDELVLLGDGELDRVKLPETFNADESYARKPDGGAEFTVQAPSEGKPNATE